MVGRIGAQGRGVGEEDGWLQICCTGENMKDEKEAAVPKPKKEFLGREWKV